MAKSRTPKEEKLRRIMAEVLEHGGEFVARRDRGVPVAYAVTEELLEQALRPMGLSLCDVVVSKVPTGNDSYVY